jgi:hypothetical protein
MSAMQAEVFEAFRAIDVPEDKALRAAAALAAAITKSEDETLRGFAKRDGAIDRLTAEVAALGAKLTAEVAALNAKLSAEVAALNARMVKLEGDIALLKWMSGFSLATTVTVLFRVFTH